MGEQTLKFLVVFFALFSIWAVAKNTSERYKINKEHNKELIVLRDSLNLLRQEKDSLYAELYPVEIELGRFHVAFRILEDRNPKAAEQFGDIISNETE